MPGATHVDHARELSLATTPRALSVSTNDHRMPVLRDMALTSTGAPATTGAERAASKYRRKSPLLSHMFLNQASSTSSAGAASRAARALPAPSTLLWNSGGQPEAESVLGRLAPGWHHPMRRIRKLVAQRGSAASALQSCSPASLAAAYAMASPDFAR